MGLKWEILNAAKIRLFPLAAVDCVVCIVLVLVLTVIINIKYYKYKRSGPKNLDSMVVNSIIAVLAAYSIFADYYLAG